MSSDYVVATWGQQLNGTAAKRAQLAIHRIDRACDLVMVSIPRNPARMLLVRPDFSRTNAKIVGPVVQCIDIVNVELKALERATLAVSA